MFWTCGNHNLPLTWCVFQSASTMLCPLIRVLLQVKQFCANYATLKFDNHNFQSCQAFTRTLHDRHRDKKQEGDRRVGQTYTIVYGMQRIQIYNVAWNIYMIWQTMISLLKKVCVGVLKGYFFTIKVQCVQTKCLANGGGVLTGFLDGLYRQKKRYIPKIGR